MRAFLDGGSSCPPPIAATAAACAAMLCAASIPAPLPSFLWFDLEGGRKV